MGKDESWVDYQQKINPMGFVPSGIVSNRSFKFRQFFIDRIWSFYDLIWPCMKQASKTAHFCRWESLYWISPNLGTHWRVLSWHTQGIHLKITIHMECILITEKCLLNESKVTSELLNGSSSNESHLWNNQCWNATTPEPFNLVYSCGHFYQPSPDGRNWRKII